MDRITKSLLEEFVASHSLGAMKESDAFERFANFCLMSRESGETFDVEDVSTGSGNDAGIDGIAIFVNGVAVHTAEQIDDLAETNGHLEANFIFVQAKTTSGFNAGDIGTFSYGVSDFFSENHQLTYNEHVRDALALQEKVFLMGARFRKNPTCHLYYVTTEKWNNDQPLLARIDSGREDLENLGLFSEVTFTPIDASMLQSMYRETKNRVSCEFIFSNRVALPEIGGVSESYLGYLPATEYLKLITDDRKRMRRELFYDNVRDFQDYNEVNKQIRETLTDNTSRDRFPVLNNGVTVVAKELRMTGTRCVISDYQIVNGCQTSHVVFDQSELLDENTFVPIKLIATNDDRVTGAITRATNTQTEVRSEELHALEDFPKKLELYFESFGDKEKLFYERRNRQYAGRPDVEKVRIVPIQNLVRAFTATFLEEPHRVGRTYKKLLDDVGKGIFADNHKLAPYYVSAYCLYKLEYFFRSGQVDVKHKPGRYQILFAVPYLALPDKKPALHSNAMDKYCEKLLEQLWDEQKISALFQQAATEVEECVETALSASPTTRKNDIYRIGIFTQTLEMNLSHH